MRHLEHWQAVLARFAHQQPGIHEAIHQGGRGGRAAQHRQGRPLPGRHAALVHSHQLSKYVFQLRLRGATEILKSLFGPLADGVLDAPEALVSSVGQPAVFSAGLIQFVQSKGQQRQGAGARPGVLQKAFHQSLVKIQPRLGCWPGHHLVERAGSRWSQWIGTLAQQPVESGTV